jgi:hypothetical protein
MQTRWLQFQLRDQGGTSTKLDDKDREPKIRCPICKWVPGRGDRWMCHPGCGHVWNTFDTRGVCPGCRHAWQETMCLRCHQMSPHEDWYTDDGEA